MPMPHSTNNGRSWKNTKTKKVFSKKGRSYKISRANSSKKKNQKSIFNKTKIFLFLLLLAFIGFLTIVFYIFWLSRGLPDPNKLLDREIAQSTKIYDRTGETVLYEIHGDKQRTLVNIKDLPDYVKWASISVEDKNFYHHKGFSLLAMMRTAVTNVLRGQRAGGSTLTQQFIKNAVLTNEKKYSRKIKELILAYRLEQKFEKDEILQMYLNEIPYGSTAYGVEAASQKYFAKHATDLTLAEAAILAALPQAPSRYSPYGSNKDLLISRQQYVLSLMVEQGYIAQSEADEAKKQELVFTEQKTNILAPHFVMYVKEILSEKYGEKTIEQNGLKIYTTLDLYKQEIAEEAINEVVEKNAEKYNASNAALVSIDPKTGQVLAMVGSRDYFSKDIDGQVNIALSKRQPGSSMKPLVYAAAFLKGYTPNTILYDVVTNFSNIEGEPYEPHNYDSAEHGPISIRKALAGSLNIPAVKALYLAGVNNVLDIADELGYSTLGDRDRFGLALVLGGAEVKLIEHVNAYSAFAREGLIQPISVILKVEDKDGNILEEYKDNSKQALDPKVSRLINDVLSDNNARAYAFGTNNWLNLGSRPVGAKTGTTNDYRDAWTIGYTPSIVTGVWVGNNDNSEMKRGAAGGVIAAPIWNKYMKTILGDTPIEEFKKPEIKETGKDVIDGKADGNIVIKIDTLSGLLATENTPEELIEEKTFTAHHSILYYCDKDNPLESSPEKPEEDPQFQLWEDAILRWAEAEENASSSTPPTEHDKLHLAENKPIFKIISPENKKLISNPYLISTIKGTAPRGVHTVSYYINGFLLDKVSTYPFGLNKDISFLNNGFHKLKVEVCDDVLNCSIETVDFNLVLDNNSSKLSNLSSSWINPSNGLALSNFDFPLEMKILVKDPINIAKVNFYSLNKNGEQNFIGSAQPVNNKEVKTFWKKTPDSGSYEIFAQIYDWQNNVKSSDKTMITVNNTVPEEKNEKEEDL